jgi:hypothetical protein
MPAPGVARRSGRANCGPESRIGITNRFRRDESETFDPQLALTVLALIQRPPERSTSI